MSVEIGTPLQSSATHVLLLGSGELGKEVVIELQRLGVEVTAADSYANAPAMQVAHHAVVLNMLDGSELRRVIETIKPDYIVPEVEAIATDTLLELEKEGFRVIPSAKATSLTMNREGIRSLAAHELGLLTSDFRFAGSLEEAQAAVQAIGLPCIIKPVMSSSGKGQGTIRSLDDLAIRWQEAMDGARGKSKRVIIEGFVQFDYEITLLTVSHRDGISFCEPIGHRQERGDYQESWQPQPMSELALSRAKEMASKVVSSLGGWGIFGVEFFVQGDTVYFSELSPRPHDTGLVTLISQDLSEFALHARAILGLPIPHIELLSPAASKAILVHGVSKQVKFGRLEEVLSTEGTSIRLFGKPEVNGERRMGVMLAKAKNVDEAIAKVIEATSKLNIQL